MQLSYEECSIWLDNKLCHFYGRLLEAVNVMAMLIDNAGTIRLFNRKAAEITGYDPAEAIGQDGYALLLPGEMSAEIRTRMMGDVLRSAEAPEAPVQMVAKNGGLLPVHWDISVVRDDDENIFGTLWLGHIVDAPQAGSQKSEGQETRFLNMANSLTHDLLNHHQVALGYVELAMDKIDEDDEIYCMLHKAYRALRKGGKLAMDVHKLSNACRGVAGVQKFILKPL